MKALESLTQLCMGVWVGAMTGFAVTAPQVFDAFGPNRQAAGDLTKVMIWRLTLTGLVLGILALIGLLPRLRQALNRWRTALVAIALGLSLFGAYFIFPKMAQVQPPNPIQTYAETDPVRVEYNRWHGYSRQVFGLAILLGAGVIAMGPLGKERA